MMERVNIAEQMIRTFIAIQVPQQLRAALSRPVLPLQELPLDVKWVPESNYHLTLKFLGNVAPDGLRLLDARLHALAGREPFSLSVGGWGMFPGVRRPSVFWAGIGGDLDALRRLNTELEDSLFESGYQRQGRFHPHITLGRFRSPAGTPGLVALLQERRPFEQIGSFKVTALHLMESRLSPSGPSYRVITAHQFRVNK